MEIIYLVGELIPCLSIGYLLGRHKENFSQLIAAPLIKYGIPISLTGILLKTGLNFYLIEAAAIALIAIGLNFAILISIPALRKQIPSRTLRLGSGFGNTGYFGIPVSIALLPPEALAYSIGFDIGATLVIWSLGPLLLNQYSNQRQECSQCKFLLKTIISSPASKGLIGAVIIQLTPWKEQITSLLWIPSKIIIVSALIIVGMRLGCLRKSSFFTIKSKFESVKSSLILKLIGLPSLMLSLCLMLRLPAIMRNALVLQAATPTAISILLIIQANSQGDEEDEAICLVTGSTLAALITLPVWTLALNI